MKWVKRILLTLVGLVVVLFAVVISSVVAEHSVQRPGMAAKSVCSAASLPDGPQTPRPSWSRTSHQPAPALKLISTEINEAEHTVTSKFLGLFKRQASLVSKRGCVLTSRPIPQRFPTAPRHRIRHRGRRATPNYDYRRRHYQTPEGRRRCIHRLRRTAGSQRPRVAVVQDGKLLIVQDGSDIQPNDALHGWSMTKTVAAMLAYKKFQEVGWTSKRP